MKRLSITLAFSLFFIAFFLNFVSAVTPHSCSTLGLTNDTILSLYDYTNSHGALWNDTVGTPVEICYNETFGKAYDPAHLNTDVHACTGSNLVLTLSSISNAHANGPLQTAYPVSVCYGDLVCLLRNTNCQGSEKEILSLSGPVNAHLERPEMNNYQYRVCCTSAWAGGTSGSICGNGVVEGGEECDGSNLNDKTCSDFGFSGGTLGCFPSGGSNQCKFNTASCTGSTFSVGETHWEDSTGSKIGKSVGIGTNVNKTVRAVANTNFNPGTTVSFLVKDADCLYGNPPCAFDDDIKTVTAQTDGAGKAAATFKITDADITAGGGSSLQFYFIASAGSSNNVSETVDVSEIQGPNSPPIANITAPIHRGLYYNGTNVLFNQSSYDSDGTLSFNWTIAEDSYKSNSSSFYYMFKTPGIKTVTLRATDDGGLWDEQEVTILVVASPGILGYINAPFNKQVVPAQSNGILALSYFANESYVVNNTVANAGTCNTGVTCLAGPCPNQTQNSPSYCGGGAIPINGAPKGFTGTSFDWTVGNDRLRNSGVGDAYSIGGRLFSQGDAGQQTINLNITYNNSVMAIGQIANRLFTMGQCIEGGHTFIKINVLTSKETSRGSTNGAYCTGQDAIAGTNDDCCPSGFVCGDPTGAGKASNYKCYGTNISSCSQYNSHASCDSANPNVLKSFPEYSQSRCGETVNGSVIECACSWKDSDSTCFLNVSSYSSNCGQSCTNPPPNYQCLVLSYNQHECINGYADVDIVRQFIPGVGASSPLDTVPQCIDETINGVLCGRPSFNLDFVSDWSMAISALFIAAIYIVFYSFKKDGKK